MRCHFVALPQMLSTTKTMITIIILIVVLPLSVSLTVANVGTALYKRSDLTRTWTEQEATRLHGRMLVDQLLPRSDVDDGVAFLDHMKLIMSKSKMIENEDVRKHIMVMVADAMGGYMHGVLLVKVKASYYEGRVGFDVTNTLYRIMRKIKFILDTDGRGWLSPVEEKKPVDNNSSSSSSSDTGDGWSDGDDLESDFAGDACEAIYSAQPSGKGGRPTVVPVPTFDDDWWPGSLAVPFAVGRRLYSVDVPGLVDGSGGGRRPLLLRYYRLAVECASIAGVADRFAADVRRWLDGTVAPLLARPRRWYPVLAGAPRVIRAAADGGRGVAARYRRRTGTTADDGLRACDDGPGGRLPNSNVFLLVVLLSLTSTWVCFGLFVVRKAVA